MTLKVDANPGGLRDDHRRFRAPSPGSRPPSSRPHPRSVGVPNLPEHPADDLVDRGGHLGRERRPVLQPGVLDRVEDETHRQALQEPAQLQGFGEALAVGRAAGRVLGEGTVVKVEAIGRAGSRATLTPPPPPPRGRSWSGGRGSGPPGRGR